LRGYQRTYNEKTNQYSNSPLHNWCSNGADAFRYFALVTDLQITEEVKEEEYTSMKTPEYTLNELFESREEDNWRTSIVRL